MIDLVPISELVEIGEQYVCSRKLFSFVNRSLNTLGLYAMVMPPKKSDDLVVFSVERTKKS